MTITVDLNSDMGESFGVYTLGDDPAMLEIVTSANVACGFHAGDPLVMHETARLAKANGVAIGAHPGFRDLWGFGRRPIMGERPEDVEKEILYQTGALQALAAAAGHEVTHRSEEHTSELQSLMRISYAVFCLKKKKTNNSNKN